MAHALGSCLPHKPPLGVGMARNEGRNLPTPQCLLYLSGSMCAGLRVAVACGTRALAVTAQQPQ